MKKSNQALDLPYFDSLDVLRFFAFFIVFLCHIPPFAEEHWFEWIRPSGKAGVYFFFVLSGFLISFILISEKKDKGRIDLKKFYIRRILRIWPLYYLFIILGFIGIKVFEIFNFSYGGEGYDPDWKFTLFFLENYKSWIEGVGPRQANFSLLWSLCLEEQFYLVWPLILSLIPLKKFPIAAILLMMVSLIVKVIYHHYHIILQDVLVVLDLFTSGALLAWVYIYKKARLEELVRKIPVGARVSYLIFVIFIIFMKTKLIDYNTIPEFFDYAIYSWLFLGVVALFLPFQTTLSFNKKNILSFLGKMTYGLYLFHSIIIRMLHHVGKKLGLPSDGIYTFVLFLIIALLLSIGISYVSFRYFESYFLRLKERFR